MFKLNPSSGHALYLQLIQQVRHAVEIGVLQPGDLLPGIRTLAETLVVSPNTVARAYSQLDHEGVLELRHGSGAYVAARRSIRSRAERLLLARERVRELVDRLQDDGLSDEEIRRLFDAELMYPELAETNR